MTRVTFSSEGSHFAKDNIAGSRCVGDLRCEGKERHILRQGLLGSILVLVLHACNGSSGQGTKTPDASPGAKDAVKDSESDTSSLPIMDGAIAFESGAADVVAFDTAIPRDAGGADVAPDAAVATDGGVVDVALGGSTDAAQDQAAGTLDSAGSGSPEAGVIDARAMDTAGDEASPGTFSCTGQDVPDSGVLLQRCYDFSDPASAADFDSEAGTWVVANGSYIATGPSDQVTCPGGSLGGSGMAASVLRGFSAQDVRVHAKLVGVTDADEVIVLRSRPGGNRIELNFRANFVDNGVATGGDLVIAELRDCVDITYVDVNTILIPHAMGRAIVVDVELVGQHLTLAMDGNVVFDRTVDVATDPGSVGFAVFQHGFQAMFDDFRVEVLK